MNIFKATNGTMVVSNYLALASIPVGAVLAFWQPTWLIVGLLMWQFMSILGITVGVHRYFSHRAFETNRFWQWTMAITSMAALNGPPCIWAEAHGRHHSKADTDEDPYLRFAIDGSTPIRHTTKVGNKFLMKAVKSDSLHLLTLKYHWLFVLSYAVALGVIGGLPAVFWLFLFPAGLTQATLRFVLWTGHLTSVGYRNFDTPDTSNNWWFVALIGGGEGWHNNHHKYPRAANIGVKWWEIDIGYWVVRMIRR